MTGKTISHYRVLEILGSGGMGVVYRAEDTRLGRPVALKFLPDDAAGAPGQRLERFRREARTASLLNHPHICVIHDVDEYEGRPFLVMELLEGQTLAQRLVTAPPTADEALRWASQIADGLQSAHHKGIIHRDIKPANIFITSRGDAKILDFGLAKFTTSSSSGADPTMMDSVRTQHGEAVGTVAYMAPEQVRGEEIDGRADIFALGIVMYELASGRRPFGGATSGVIFDAILNRTPDPIPSDPGLERVVFKALEKDRTLRYQTADDLLADLRRLQRDSGTSRSGTPPVATKPVRRRRAAATIAAVAVIGAAVAAWQWLGPDAAAPAAAELRPVRLTANPSEYPVSGATLSPDGKLLAYSDPRGIQLLVIASNETQSIPETQGIVVGGWSNDGTRVLGHRQAGSEPPTHWSISILAAGGRRPVAMAGLTSPDGRSTLVFKEDHTAWIESANGQRQLASLKLEHDPFGIALRGLDWTPDSRRILVLRGRTRDAARELIAIDPLADRLDVLLSSDDLPRFTESMTLVDANRVIFAVPEVRGTDAPSMQTDRNLWEARLDRRGPARRMTNWTGFNIQSVSVTPDGRRLSFLQTKYQEDVWVAGLEAGNTRLVNPQRLTVDDRNDRPFGWTADSRAVLFSSNRSGTTDILVQDALRDAGPQTLAGGPGMQSLARVTADGKWVLFIDGGPPRRLMRVAAAGATPEEVVHVPNMTGIRCGLAPASPCLIDESSPDAEIARLVDPMGGLGETLFRRPPGSNFAPAPAFDRFGYVLPPKAGGPRNTIQLVNRAGVPQERVTAAGATMLNSLDYAADGQGFFTSDYSTDLGARLLYVSLSGATSVLWHNRASFRTWGVPSPDGKWLAMLGATQESNVWVLDGF